MKRWHFVLGVILLLVCCSLVVTSARFLGSTLLIDWIAYLGAGVFGATLIGTLFSKNYSLSIVAFVLLLSAASYPELSHMFHLQDVESGKSYVSLVVPVLDKYRSDHGSYPASLSEVSAIQSAPYGIQYGTLGDGYYFIITDPQAFDYDRYDSSNRIWRRDN